MSEKSAKPKDVISLNVETNLQTTEGRIFLNQLRQVSRVLLLKDMTVDFKGEEILKTSYVGEFKSISVYKCLNGYFLFGDKIYGKHNWSIIGKDLDELLAQISDEEIKKLIAQSQTSATPVA